MLRGLARSGRLPGGPGGAGGFVCRRTRRRRVGRGGGARTLWSQCSSSQVGLTRTCGQTKAQVTHPRRRRRGRDCETGAASCTRGPAACSAGGFVAWGRCVPYEWTASVGCRAHGTTTAPPTIPPLSQQIILASKLQCRSGHDVRRKPEERAATSQLTPAEVVFKCLCDRFLHDRVFTTTQQWQAFVLKYQR